jgi:uncharacterized membrane protein
MDAHLEPTPTLSAAQPRSAPARPDAARGARLVTPDALRGIAVVLMVCWHAASGWLALEHRTGTAWNVARVIGGLAAPIFLLVAGATVAIGATRGRSIADVVRRGAEVVVFGLALRLFLWAVDSRAAAKLESWSVICAGVLAFGLAIFGLRARRSWALAIAALVAAAYVWLAIDLAGPATRRLFNFDVLHAIGVSTILVAIALRTLRASKLANVSWVVLGLAAVVLAAITPSLGAALASPWLAWLARPDDLRPFAAFPLLPWSTYAFFGAAAVLAPRPKQGIVLLAAAVGAAFVSFEGGFLWTQGLLGELPWLRPIARLVFHAACTLVLALAVSSLRRGVHTLVVAGQLSLAIYCAHLEFAFGLAARPIVRSLDPVECALGASALVAACLLAAHAYTFARARLRSRARRATQEA